MADAKVNMSLDDIIKMNKKQFPKKQNNNGGGAGGARRGGARAGGARGGARAGGRGGARGTVQVQRGGKKFGGAARRPVQQQQRVALGKRGAGFRASAAANSAQTKKLVNKLVKKALKTRLGGAAVAARRLPVANRGVAVARAAGVLSRVNARSRVIGKSVTRPVQPVIRTRPFARTVYADEVDEEPVIIQQQRPRPRPQQVIVERVIQAPQPQRTQVIRRISQPKQQRVIVQQQPRQQIRQRIIQQRVQRPRQQQQRVIVVERQAPIQRVQRVQNVIQRIQRPQIIRQRQQQPRQQVVQYVQARNRKNNNFRNAVGAGPRRFAQVEVERFEPSTSFLTRKVIRRGRGFQQDF